MKSRDVFTKIVLGSSIVLLMSLIAGCGESSTEEHAPQEGTISDDTSSRPSTVTGQFIDAAAVEGLTYSCSSNTSGVTDANGSYTCDIGDDVTFSMGAVILGSVAAQSGVITPYVLFPEDLDAALNLARLLQSVDSDGEPTNGVVSIDGALASLLPVNTDLTSLTFESSVESALDIVLISATMARENLDAGILLAGGQTPGDLTIPVADAGTDQSVNTGSLVTLDGSRSGDSNEKGTLISHKWRIVARPDGSDASLDHTDMVDPNLIADKDGRYIIELVVNNGTIDSAADMVVISASSDDGVQAPEYKLSTTGVDSDADGIIDQGIIIYTYDKDGNILMRKEDQNGDGEFAPIETWAYDPDGNMLNNAVDNNGDGVNDLEVVYTYDENGNMLTWKHLDRYGTSYGENSYDEEGDLVRSVDHDRTVSSINHYSYDKYGYIAVRDFDRDADGEIDSRQVFVNDGQGNILTSSWDGNADGQFDSIHTFTFDTEGNILTSSDDDDADGVIDDHWVHRYDELGNILGSEHHVDGDVYIIKLTYTYDLNGNILSQSSGDVDSTYFIRSYRYDENSNMLESSLDAHADGTIDNYEYYTYDENDNMLTYRLLWIGNNDITTYYTWIVVNP